MPFKLRICPADSKLIGSSFDHYRKFHIPPPKDFRKENWLPNMQHSNCFQLIIFVFMSRHSRQENAEIMLTV